MRTECPLDLPLALHPGRSGTSVVLEVQRQGAPCRWDANAINVEMRSGS